MSIYSLFSPFEVHAANAITNPALNTSLQALNGVTFTQRLIPALILGGLAIGVLFFFFNLLSGAISWINSGGDKAQVEAARSKTTNAVVGVVVLFLIFMIVNLVGAFLGTNLTLIDLNSLKI